MKHYLDISGVGFYTVDREPFCLGYPVYSVLHVCPLCRKTWATLTVEGEEIWIPQFSPCERCVYSKPSVLKHVPGSILGNNIISMTGIDWGLLEVLPDILLRREFDLLLRSCP